MTGTDWTERYPWIVEDVARLKAFGLLASPRRGGEGERDVALIRRPPNLFARLYVMNRF